RCWLSEVLGAAEEWKYIADNPVRKTRLPRREYKSERPSLAPAQVWRLIITLQEPARSVAMLLAILSGLHKKAHDPNDLIFSTRSGAPLCRRNLLHRHLQPTCKGLGLPRMSWHTLRHCDATLLDAAGAPLRT